MADKFNHENDESLPGQLKDSGTAEIGFITKHFKLKKHKTKL